MSCENRRVFIVIVFISIILHNTSCIQGRSIELSDTELNFTQLAGKYGYHAEEHTVTTEDGYILKIFRMRARQCEGERPPVLVTHGLLISADVFLDAGPDTGLAYLLADACNDLWFGNSRGNTYSRGHITLDPDKDSEYWNFSFDQMGYYDNPATIDYILNVTGFEKLGYIGYSQGSSIGFIMCSERPGYCDKFNVFINLAPSSRHLNSKSPFSRAMSLFFMKAEPLLDRLGIREVLAKPTSASTAKFTNMFCHSAIGEATTRSIFAVLDNYHGKSVSSLTIRTTCARAQAGTSLHNLAHYGQAMTSKDFQKFDYGVENMKIYGSEGPPSYNIAATTVPVVLIYGENDGMADPSDVRWLASQLPNVVESYLVPNPKWNHLDFVYSQYIPDLIFPKIQEYLLKYNM
ncbi:lipase 1-like [Plodia interpunctella]|uniref:lipase 1-like n=1 Tax=Plodia interpunctella TaxID=58824 RepID=UPI002367F965|nr:lipase 1-like [Plodia interpunctella]